MPPDPPSGSAVAPHPRRPRCPICGRTLSGSPEASRVRPFCSARCADVDLHRWLGGAYRIATAEEPDPGEPLPTSDREP